MYFVESYTCVIALYLLQKEDLMNHRLFYSVWILICNSFTNLIDVSEGFFNADIVHLVFQKRVIKGEVKDARLLESDPIYGQS